MAPSHTVSHQVVAWLPTETRRCRHRAPIHPDG